MAEKTPAQYKGLQKDEVIAVAQKEKKSLREKTAAKITSVIESQKTQKAIITGGSIGLSGLLEGLSQMSETAAKYDAYISGAAALAGAAGAYLADDETTASVSMAALAAGGGRLAQMAARAGVAKYKAAKAGA